MFTEPKFGLRNRLCEMRDHLGSLERRVRNDDANAVAPTDAIPMATTILMVNCVM